MAPKIFSLYTDIMSVVCDFLTPIEIINLANSRLVLVKERIFRYSTRKYDTHNIISTLEWLNYYEHCPVEYRFGIQKRRHKNVAFSVWLLDIPKETVSQYSIEDMIVECQRVYFSFFNFMRTRNKILSKFFNMFSSEHKNTVKTLVRNRGKYRGH